MSRGRRVAVKVPPWWPPQIGDKLRKEEIGYDGPTEYLCHVVSVFVHDTMPRVVVAWFGKHKQWWHYEIFDGYQAHLGMVWRDGEQNPKSPK